MISSEISLDVWKVAQRWLLLKPFKRDPPTTSENSDRRSNGNESVCVFGWFSFTLNFEMGVRVCVIFYFFFFHLCSDWSNAANKLNNIRNLQYHFMLLFARWIINRICNLHKIPFHFTSNSDCTWWNVRFDQSTLIAHENAHKKQLCSAIWWAKLS